MINGILLQIIKVGKNTDNVRLTRRWELFKMSNQGDVGWSWYAIVRRAWNSLWVDLNMTIKQNLTPHLDDESQTIFHSIEWWLICTSQCLSTYRFPFFLLFESWSPLCSPCWPWTYSDPLASSTKVLSAGIPSGCLFAHRLPFDVHLQFLHLLLNYYIYIYSFYIWC